MSALASRPSAKFWIVHNERRALWRVLWKSGRTGWRSAGGKRAVRRWAHKGWNKWLEGIR